MTVTFNHTIIASKDKNASAAFYRELFELPEAPSWGPFANVQLDEGVLLQFAEPPVDIQMQHYAFLVDDELFVRCLAFVEGRGITYWADPQLKRRGGDQHRARWAGLLLLRPGRPRHRDHHPAVPVGVRVGRRGWCRPLVSVHWSRHLTRCRLGALRRRYLGGSGVRGQVEEVAGALPEQRGGDGGPEGDRIRRPFVYVEHGLTVEADHPRP